MPCNQRHCKENSLKRGGQMANPLLQHYIKLTEFLGQALGPDYEVALHDMTDKNRSIVAIANNHISGISSTIICCTRESSFKSLIEFVTAVRLFETRSAISSCFK